MEKKRKSSINKKEIEKREKGFLIEWWLGTVVLTFLPTFFLILISLIKDHFVDFDSIIGEGELVLSSFLVLSSSIVSLYKSSGRKSTNKSILFYISSFVAALQLVSYITIKVVPKDMLTIYITSALSVVSSLITSENCENALIKGGDKL